MEEMELMETQIYNGGDFMQLMLRFFFNLVMVLFIIHFLYYKKSKRRDYYFTFFLISISIFFLIFLLGGVKLKIGFALGLFAIFGIIRYRTESMPVREMTYLFVIIAMSVINALAVTISYAELIVVNAVFIGCTWVFESRKMLKHVSTKLVQYDHIELIKPDRMTVLIADLCERTGLNVQKVEVGGIDFLKDMAVIKIYYEEGTGETNTVNGQTKISGEEWRTV